MRKSKYAVAMLILAMAACGPRIRPLQPVTQNGEVIRSRADDVTGDARAEGELERSRMAAEGRIAPPLAPCGDAICMAEELVRQGDEYTAAGRLDMALERYDQADILVPGDPHTNLRIARVLDKQLRPVEAVMRYQMFIHQMELERIRAEGEVAASIAEAIARAHERIIVLERR